MWNTRPRVLALVLFSLGNSVCFGQIPVPMEGLESITPQEMYDHVAYLASDEMRGRNTPSPELEQAAQYIAQEFSSYGLDGPGVDGMYFQPFNLQRVALSTPNTLTVLNEAGEEEFRIKYDFVPLHLSASRSVEAPVAFVGYGITAPEYDYDDYENIDVAGKIVLMLSHEPQQKDTSSVFDGAENTGHSKLVTKAQTAIEHGAAGMLIVKNPNNYRFRRPPNRWASLMKNPPKDRQVPLTLEEEQEKKIVAAYIGRKLAEYLVESSGNTLSEWQTLIDADVAPHSFEVGDRKVRLEISLDAETETTKSVVGYWSGDDPELQDELVVIGAHYDHIGAPGDTVYNGADDNASGTAGVLEIAEAFASSPQRPHRSILFITFAGEEKGLFGSRYYTEHPLFPIESTVAMLNLDMISRNDTNEVAIIGTKTSSDLKEINERANENVGLLLDYDQDRWFRQSDHYSFYRKDIPVLFYNTKNHPDLHKPTDDIDKIIPEKMARIGKLIFSTAWMVANQSTRPCFTEIDRSPPEQTQEAAEGK